jgi:hypothetical protein
MNANELADELEKLNKMSLFDFDAAFDREKADATVTMLRQQQAEIEALKVDLKYWTNPCDPLCKPSICDCYKARFAISNRKTLTDEEIKELSEKHLDMDWQTGVIEFARAILRKAQEK